MIRSVPLFATCGPNDLQRVAQLLDEVDVPAGHVLMREGETGREMFLVVSGRARGDRQGRHIADFGPGAVVGGWR